jgi:uncharacterized protein YkwD
MRRTTLRPAHVRSLLRPLVIALSTALLLLGVTGTAQAATWDVPTSRTDAPAADLDEFEDQLMVEINQARRHHDRSRIRVYDTCADRMAESWGSHLASTGRFEHRDQNKVLRRCDVSWAGENLIRGAGLTPEVMVKAWLDSPGHRAILLSGKARRAGVSVTQDGQGRLVGVLNLVRNG